MLIKYETNVVQKFPDIYNFVQESYLQNTVFYMLDSNVRKSVQLKSWLKEQVTNPSKELQDLANTIKGKDYDELAVNCLRKVQSIITYKKDSEVWKATEKWQTAQETLSLKTGDCEDGAVLTYILCRLKGIQSNRLMVLAGDVKGGGHCFLGYKPINYPLNFVFLDWCYWYNKNSIDVRNKFYIDKDNKVFEFDYQGNKVNTNYYKLWFGVNEDYNVKNFKYQFGRNCK